MEIHTIIEAQRAYFLSNQSKSLFHRKEALKQLELWITKHEQEIVDALHQDLRKSSMEAYMSEIGTTLSELRFHLKHLSKWVKRKYVHTPLAQFYSRSFFDHEPYGVVFIMAPWNYPFLLCMEPLIGALSAGNCVILKPSAYAPATSALLHRMVKELFPPEFVCVVEGGRKENSLLLEERFDYIFFTGSVEVGKLVMEKASRHLTPVTLELGGKSPCVVEKSANLKVSAKRIVFGKFLNSGQTCVAPDYLLVDNRIKDELIKEIKKQITICFGQNPLENPHLPCIINAKHFKRLTELMKDSHIVYGGESDNSNRLIAPTLVTLDTSDHPLMKEEIFGPILPILTYTSLDEAIVFLKSQAKPLALYLFTNNKKVEKQVMGSCSFGGGCVNDTIIHLASSHLPFGGVGNSGMGNYHGYASFETFSHQRSIVKKSFKIDLPMRYQPYTKTKEKLVRFFLK